MDNERDRRVIKTRKSIQTTLVTMMKERSYQDISVSNLCRYADIGRGTFYLHYNDIYEVVHELEDGILESFKDLVFQYFEEENNASLQTLISKCLFWIKDNPDYFQVFLMPSNIGFAERFEEYAIDLFYYHNLKYHPSQSSEETRYIISRDVLGILGAIRSWYKEKMTLSPEAFSKVLVQH